MSAATETEAASAGRRGTGDPRGGREAAPYPPQPLLPRHRRLAHRRLRRPRLVRRLRGAEQAHLGDAGSSPRTPGCSRSSCLPFSLLVGLLVKYAKAPSNLDDSLLDSLTGDVTHLRWRDLPATVATSIASLFSGAVLGPEGAIGNIASKIAALYCDLFRVPADRRPRLVFASVSSGYNGLLENPVFAAVLGTEVAETKRQGLSTLPASLIGGVVGYGVFLLLHNTGFVDFLHLPPVQGYDIWDAVLMVPLALVGLVLAVVTAAFMKLSAGGLRAAQGPHRPPRARRRRHLQRGRRARARSSCSPARRRCRRSSTDAAGYGVALLLVMAVGKLALLGVGFKSGFLGGPTFPLIFASTSVALALNLVVARRAGGGLPRRHHGRRRLRALPHAADGGAAHGLHARRRPDDGGADRAGRRHGDDRRRRRCSGSSRPGRPARTPQSG